MKFLALFFVICSVVSCISAYPYPIGYPYSGLPTVGTGFGGVGVPAFGGYGMHGHGLHHHSFIPPPPAPLGTLGGVGLLPPPILPPPVPVHDTIF